MNKKILFISLIALAIGGVVFKSINSSETEVDKLRKQHAEFLKNHPYQKTGELPKKERKAQGLPPNAYFEQKHLSEINPATGKTYKENIYKLQKTLNKQRVAQKVPGEADNAWIERGPDNVGGRTRALIFDPNDTTNETVFAGGVSGGLWKNTNISNPDSKWVRVGIDENLAVSCIAVDPNNPKIFYVGTGETFVNGEINGDGLWKTTDGGNTWNRVVGRNIQSPTIEYNVKLTVNSPASIAKDYIAVLSKAFGNPIDTPITTDIILVEDDNSDTTISPTDTNDICDNITNASELEGKIAVVRRGGCNFSLKALKVQEAGAKAIIVVNNQDTPPFNMAAGTDGPNVTIPSIMLSKVDGEGLISALNTEAVNVTLTGGNFDAVNGIATVSGIHHINDILVRNNGGVSEVYIAVGDVFYRHGTTSLGGDSIGVYKSIDGENFTKLDMPRTSGGNNYEPINIKLSPSDNSIYVSTTRSSSFGDGGGAILKSTDGNTFALKHIVADGRRTEIALSPTNPGTVYALVHMSDDSNPVKIFKTTDDFVDVNDLSLPNDVDNGIPANDFTRGQAWYDLLLRVDPNDENILYVGGIDLFKSTNGGSSWSQISKWSNNNDLISLPVSKVHADQHGLAFASSSKMVLGNDGGVYFSNNSGTNIEARNNNYNTVQFYTLGVAPTTAFEGKEFIVAGAQDNGTHAIQDGVSGINSSDRVSGGDGAASFFDTDGSDQYLITNYVFNQAINLFNYKTAEWVVLNDENTRNGDFINQEELDSNLNILYSNYSSDLNGNIIRRYSNITTSNSVVKNNLSNSLMTSGPSTLKISPYTTNSSTLFLGLKNGKLIKVENADVGPGDWSEITGPNFVGSISDIEFGENENQIFVTMHNYGVVSVWYSENGGSSWKNKEGNLPDIPVKSILQNPLNIKEVIVGTDLGVWKTSNFDESSPTWTQSYNGMSNVPVLDLDLRDDNVVFAATYGRGIFSGEFKLDPNGDADGDGVLNGVDNCPTTANPNQEDVDNNDIGDVCQDTDGDGVLDIDDNCPETSNPDQADADNNNIGDVCQDTDGDGVMDSDDNCLTTANLDQADVNNNNIGDVCDTSYTIPNSISVESISETCVGENDGKIIVNVKEVFVDYTVTLNGGTAQTITGTATSTTYENLAPGTYEICVVVDGRDYKQCFELEIKEANTVSLRVAKKQSTRSYIVNISSGTAPYNVYLNGSLIETFNSSTFDVKVQGSGVLEVETAKSCEGRFKMVIDNVFLKRNPVSSSIELLMPNDADSNVNVTIFDITGKTILKDNIQRQGNQLSIPFDSFKSGIYILKLGNDNTNTFKILK